MNGTSYNTCNYLATIGGLNFIVLQILFHPRSLDEGYFKLYMRRPAAETEYPDIACQYIIVL